MVGVLLGDIVDPYFAEIVRGIEDVARRAGYLVVVCNTGRDPGTERRYVTALRDYRADAILLLGGDIFDQPTIRRALVRELNTLKSYGGVAVAVAGDHAELPAIDIDHAAGAEEVVRYLVGLGHSRIAFISGPMNVSTARYRREGFLRAMHRAGLSTNLIEEGDFTYSCGQVVASRLLDRAPTAIFAANDQMALGVLAACRAAGVAVPDQVSVVGFGNTNVAEQAVPALTAISMPRHQLGMDAMHAVLDALESNGTSDRVVHSRTLPFHLVIRESSSGVRRKK
jgi:DNA-binding LacI/PurR family transcriptional regulator